MKNIFKVSKTGRSINLNGAQISNFDLEGNQILPKFLEKYGDIEFETESEDIITDFKNHQLAAFTERFEREEIEKKKNNANLSEKWAKEQAENWAAIKDLPVIPATAENVRTLLFELNSQNWGGWSLPRLSIGYKCAQFDCDGQTATTITLDRTIKVDEFCKPHNRYQVGAPFGHLGNFNRI